MALPASFHPEAEVDLVEGMRWYDGKQPGLGVVFAEAVQEAVRFAADFPDAGAPLGPILRRAFVRAFPYYVLYAHEVDRVFVVAIAHFRRRPGYWRDRI